MASPASLSEFKGIVVAVPTALFWDDELEALQGRVDACWPKVDATVAAEKNDSWENNHPTNPCALRISVGGGALRWQWTRPEGAAEPALEDHVQRHMQPVTAEEAAGIAVGGTRFVGHGVADAQGAAGAGGDEPLGKHGKHGEADQANGESGQILVADKQRVAEE